MFRNIRRARRVSIGKENRTVILILFGTFLIVVLVLGMSCLLNRQH
jgi:hypothetical protein